MAAPLVEDAVRVSEAAIVPRGFSDLVRAAVGDLLINDTRQSLSNGSGNNELVADSDVIAPETVSSGELVRAPPASVDGLPKKLLILDVNGFLIDTCFKFDKSKSKLREPDGTVNNFLIYARPHCGDFVKFCLDNFVVGVWSSARRHNVEGLTRYIFGESVTQLAFIWGQDMCTDTGLRHPENRNKPIFLKELTKVWQTPPFRGVYGPSNTLLIDDSAYKALRNPAYTGVFPETYHADGPEEDYLAPTGRIRSFLQGVHLASDVRDYVKANPFGQAGISVGDDYTVEITGDVNGEVRETTRRSYEEMVRQLRDRAAKTGPVNPNRAEEPGASDWGMRPGNGYWERPGHREENGGWGDETGPRDLGREHPRLRPTGWDSDVLGGHVPNWPSAEDRGFGGIENGQHLRNGYDDATWQAGGLNGRHLSDRGWSDDEGAPGTEGRERSRSPIRMRQGRGRMHDSEREGVRGWEEPAGRPESGWELNGRQTIEGEGFGRSGWDVRAHGASEGEGFGRLESGLEWPRVNGEGYAGTEAGWDPNGRPHMNGRPGTGWGADGRLDSDTRPTTRWGSERLWKQGRNGAVGWGQPAFDDGPDQGGPFLHRPCAPGEYQIGEPRAVSYWARPAFRPGGNRPLGGAPSSITFDGRGGQFWRPKGQSRPPGGVGWEVAPGYGLAPPQRAEIGPVNGLERGAWGACGEPAQDWGEPRLQAGGQVPFTGQYQDSGSRGGQYQGPGLPFQGLGSRENAPRGRVPLPPFRDYSQVTDPDVRHRSGQQRPLGVSRDYRGRGFD